jgi:hypothetical protein
MAFLFWKRNMKSFLLLFFSAVSFSLSQEYPRWFLFQGEVHSQWNAVAMTPGSTYQRDSAVAFGFRKGCEILARYAQLQISGGQAFWDTEAGTFSMGSNYVETFDTSLVDRYITASKVLDAYSDKMKTFVLVGDSSSELNEEVTGNVSMKNIKEPTWTETLPENRNFFYGVGLSQEYFYEQSSWMAAEKNAYMAIARTIRIKVQALQKEDAREGQDVRNEDVNALLQNVEIVARWRDIKRKIFYVLARVKK